MKFLEKSSTLLLLTLGLGLGSALSAGGRSGAFQEYPHPQEYPRRQAYPRTEEYTRTPYPAPYTDLRDVVDRTQSDLRASADLEHGNEKQRDRYHDAQGHLSSFDRHLTKGRFDKGELDKSIDKIKDILDHNVLQASSRDALLRDLDDLRAVRSHRY